MPILDIISFCFDIMLSLLSCFSLVGTDPISPNKSIEVMVEKCDHGPLIFQVQKNEKPGWYNNWSKFVRL